MELFIPLPLVEQMAARHEPASAHDAQARIRVEDKPRKRLLITYPVGELLCWIPHSQRAASSLLAWPQNSIVVGLQILTHSYFS